MDDHLRKTQIIIPNHRPMVREVFFINKYFKIYLTGNIIKSSYTDYIYIYKKKEEV